MAHYATKCIQCTDTQKKCIRTRLKDEDGNVFYEQMYECENGSCKVNKGISTIQREIHMAEKKREGVKRYEENHYNRKRIGKRRANNR